MVLVSASEAAARLTRNPEYGTHAHECRGVCIEGTYALAWDHPKCCFIPHRGHKELQPYSQKPLWHGSKYVHYQGGPEDVSPSNSDFWVDREWFCTEYLQ